MSSFAPIDPDELNCNDWTECYGYLQQVGDQEPKTFNYVFLGLDSSGWHYAEKQGSLFDIPLEDLVDLADCFKGKSLSEFACNFQSGYNDDFPGGWQGYLCTLAFRNQVASEIYWQDKCLSTKSTETAFSILSNRVGYKVEPDNKFGLYEDFFKENERNKTEAADKQSPADIAKAASRAAHAGPRKDDDGGTKHGL